MKPSYYFLLSLSLLAFLACEPAITVKNSSEKSWTETDRQFIITELNRTTDALKKEIDNLKNEQWNFRETPERWSIAEIVEHLEMQNQLHYRELSVVKYAPQYLQFTTITKGQDQYFSNYATDTNKGQARWFLEPSGRFCTKEAGANAFFRARGELTKWVIQTPIDLRKQFTFRTPVEGKKTAELKIGQVRDLHQLLLTGIAHTDRHLRQIKAIKKHTNFPEFNN